MGEAKEALWALVERLEPAPAQMALVYRKRVQQFCEVFQDGRGIGSAPGLELHLHGAFAIPFQWPAGDRCMRWAERQPSAKSLARRGA